MGICMLLKLKKFLDDLYKPGDKPDSKGNASYYCPFCNHHKKKLVINLDPKNTNFQKYHCWVCNAKGGSIFSLLKRTNKNTFYFTELKNILGKKYGYTTTNKPIQTHLELPKDIHPLHISDNSPEYKAARVYL